MSSVNSPSNCAVGFTVADVARPGWTAEILVSHFQNIGAARGEVSSSDYALRVLSHLDAIVAERACEVLRSFGVEEGVIEKVTSSEPADVRQAMMAIESVMWSLTTEYPSFDAVYEMASDSLTKQELNVLSALASTCMERAFAISELYGIDPGTGDWDYIRDFLYRRDDAYGLFEDLRRHADAMTNLLEGLKEYRASPYELVRESVMDILGRSVWVGMAMSGSDPRSSISPTSSIKMPLAGSAGSMSC